MTARDMIVVLLGVGLGCAIGGAVECWRLWRDTK